MKRTWDMSRALKGKYLIQHSHRKGSVLSKTKFLITQTPAMSHTMGRERTAALQPIPKVKSEGAKDSTDSDCNKKSSSKSKTDSQTEHAESQTTADEQCRPSRAATRAAVTYRLEVSVSIALAVHVGDCRQYLAEDNSGLLL